MTPKSPPTKKTLDKLPESEYKEARRYEKSISDSLMILGIIGSEYSGSVTIHFCDGGISDYEKSEKGLRKRINLKG